MTELDRIFTTREVYPWHIIQQLTRVHVGDVMYHEAERQQAKIVAELQRQMPDHEIDTRNMLLEIGIRYLVPGEEGQ